MSEPKAPSEKRTVLASPTPNQSSYCRPTPASSSPRYSRSGSGRSSVRSSSGCSCICLPKSTKKRPRRRLLVSPSPVYSSAASSISGLSRPAETIET